MADTRYYLWGWDSKSNSWKSVSSSTQTEAESYAASQGWTDFKGQAGSFPSKPTSSQQESTQQQTQQQGQNSTGRTPRYHWIAQTPEGKIRKGTSSSQQEAYQTMLKGGWMFRDGAFEQTVTDKFGNVISYTPPQLPDIKAVPKSEFRRTESLPGGEKISMTMQDILNQRSDLQKYYNPDGTAKDASAPQIKGMPTIQDWWKQYGQKEYPGVTLSSTTNNQWENDWARSEQAAKNAGLITGDKIGEGNDKTGKESDQNIQDAYKIIDDALSQGRITPEEADLMKDVVDYYQADTFDPQEILNTYNKIKEETIDPYYAELTKLSIEGLKTNIAAMREQRLLEEESERMRATEDIRQTRAGLEGSGLTFTGEGVRQLGEASATAGIQGPGLVQQQSNLMASSSAARYQENLKKLGLTAEAQLGSAGLGGVGFSEYNPLGGITGSLPTQKEASLGSTLSALTGNALRKTSFQNPIQYPYQ